MTRALIRRDYGAPDEPVARKAIFTGFRYAAEKQFGPVGLEAIGRALPRDTYEATFAPPMLVSDWFPETHVMAWYETVWSGPANREMAAMAGFLDAMMDHGFGRIRRFLLGFGSPKMLLDKAEELWAYDHNTGVLRTKCAEREGWLELTDHVYTSTALSRQCITEIYRYAMSLTRVKDVTSSYKLESEHHLIVRLTWK